MSGYLGQRAELGLANEEELEFQLGPLQIQLLYLPLKRQKAGL